MRTTTFIGNSPDRAADSSSTTSTPCWIALPLIPGLNDDEGHLENFASTIKALGRVQAVELLPYHRLGKNKYALLGRAYALESLGPMSKEDLARRAAFVAERLGGTKVLF